MKKLVIVCIVLVFFQVGKLLAQADSTCYFASWLSSNGLWYTAKNTVVKVPSIWTLQKVNDVVKEKDRFMIYMTYLTKVPNEIYVESLLVDSLVPKTNTGPDVKNAIKTKWFVKYAILDGDSMQGQGQIKITKTGKTQTFHPRQVENYIKESDFIDPKIRIVIMEFQKM